ncbi:MAG: HAMP domain-containing histidine kinase [Cyanobacteria bacterium SZAS LIN-2]|nr:HAMP domain-containing histidine kinase [Cyanobacteria bacterium SZAS LIN-3]MBS1994712.1 HAMP domain-containing histidine kinase [Cyanobacteria bacterium SZAS LIN-2]
MIKIFRLKLTIYFVVLSLIVYVVGAVSTIVFFKGVLTKALDDRLMMLASEVGHAIDIHGDSGGDDALAANGDTAGSDLPRPRLRNWQRQVVTDPARGLASAQLFDKDGNLIEGFGPDGVKTFFKRAGEVREDGRSYRVLYTPLKVRDTVVGYVQVNTSTHSRDVSVDSLLSTLCWLGPLIVLGLGASSYYVSGIAAEPLLENMQTMRRFIEDAGHELNTPLSIVRAKSEALERKLGASGADSELAATLRSVGRMEKIVSDLMYLTELDTQSMTERFEVTDISTLLGQLSEDFAARFAAKGVAFKVADLHAQVRCEPDVLYRAISNLTENALRYTDQGSVEISARAEHDHVVITIADTGIGIPEESRSRIFERFYRVDKSRSRASGGVGLGLSIVKAIVEAHRGTIVLASCSGKGTQFVLTLPCA